MIYWEVDKPQFEEVEGDVRGTVVSSLSVGAKDAQLVAKGINEEVWCLANMIYQEVDRPNFEVVGVDGMRNGCE